MKCIKIGSQITSLENVKIVYTLGDNDAIIRIDYFNKDWACIDCGDTLHSSRVLDVIFKILKEKA